MTSISSNQARQARSYIVFAVVALASLVFWGVELKLSMASHDERQEEVLTAYQQRQLELKSEVVRDTIQELYQAGRTISLLPAIREARGGNRRSEIDDVVKQGRLPVDSHRMLQQLYASLSAYVRVSEIYFVMDGFDPANGQVPFFMYDDLIAVGMTSKTSSEHSDVPDVTELEEYDEILRQLAWFRENAPTFTYETKLNTIPVLMSGPLLTCDTTQLFSKQFGELRDATGFVYSVPVYDASTGKFKGQVSIILRANVLEARLLEVPFLPLTPSDLSKMSAQGWKMPPPSPFVLIEKTRQIEISDRRSQFLAGGLAAALKDSTHGGRWASMQIQLPSSGQWELHHHLSEPEMEQLVGGIRSAKRWSLAGRVLLLVVLTAFLGWGFWLLRGSRRELIKMAHYDLLTDLPNRRLFFDRMENGMARSLRNKTKMGLFFVDVAGLNAINDRHGHHGGDKLLVTLAKRLHDHLRETDGIFGRDHRHEGNVDKANAQAPLNFTLSRLGGDEFTIVCEDLRAGDDLIIVAERILKCVKEPIMLSGDKVEITLNVGAALFPDDAADAERMLMNADSAMH